MRNILKIFVLLAAIGSAHAQGTTEALSGYTLSSASAFLSGTGGWEFQPATDMQVTSLGCLAYLVGPQDNIQVGLWANGGQLLASASVSAASPLLNFTLYAAINQVFLNAGGTYLIGIYSASGLTLNNVTQGSDGSATLTPDLQLLGAAYSTTATFGYPSTVGPNNTLLLGPNFQYRPVVPEPSVLALLGLGGLGLAFWRKTRPCQ